jgi:hypothetical protein
VTIELSASIGSNRRVCLGLFAAADALGLGFMHGAPQHLYLERLDADALHQLGLLLENPGQKPDV